MESMSKAILPDKVSVETKHSLENFFGKQVYGRNVNPSNGIPVEALCRTVG